MKKQFAGTEFINVRLSASDQKKVLAWRESIGYELVEFVHGVITDGYKISISADVDRDCVIASITGKAGRGANAGCTMTSRGPDIDTALLITAYKHYALFDGKTWESEEGGDNWG